MKYLVLCLCFGLFMAVAEANGGGAGCGASTQVENVFGTTLFAKTGLDQKEQSPETERRGCCSHHGGVCGCSSGGRAVCCDGSLSPSCGCD